MNKYTKIDDLDVINKNEIESEIYLNRIVGLFSVEENCNTFY